MSSCSTVALLVAAVAIAPQDPVAPQRDQGQQVTDTRILDRDLAFSLTRPDRKWRILPEQEAKQLAPDTIAGMIALGPPHHGSTGCVVVEQAHGATLATMVDLILENMDIEKKEIISRQPSKLCGTDCVHFVVRGETDDIRLRYSGWVLIRDDIVFQFLAFGLDSQVADGRFFAAFKKAIRLEPGKVRRRIPSALVPDCHGIGWWVRNNEFQSAASRLAVTRAGDWRLRVGGELQQMNSDAEVGLQHLREEIYVVIIHEALDKEVDGFDEASLQALRVHKETGKIKFPVLGAEHRFTVFESQKGAPVRYLHAGWIEWGRGWQILAWHLGPQREEVVDKALRQALARVRRLDEATTSKLATALSRLPDNENTLGLDYVLRNRVYRDFKYELTWTKPKQGLWKAVTGSEAREGADDGIRLFVEELSSGIGVTLLPEMTDDHLTPDQYHKNILVNVTEELSDAEVGKTRTSRLHGRPAMTTVVNGLLKGAPFQYHATTVTLGKRYTQLIVGGYQQNLQRAKGLVQAAVQGLRIHARLPQVERKAGGYVDHRLGFGVKPIPGARFTTATTPANRPYGGVLTVTAGSRIMAVVATSAPGLDESWFVRQVQAVSKAQGMFDIISGKPKHTERTVFLGRRATRMVYKTWFKSSEFLVTTRHNTFYGALLDTKPDEWKQLRDALYLID